MNTNITNLHVLALIYGEIQGAEASYVFQAIKTHPDLYSFYVEAIQMKLKLDEAIEHPSPTSLDIVLEHSHDSFTESV